MNPLIHSIQARLRNISKAQGQSHQLTLIRYFQERLLFRLSVYPYKSHFFLKGGVLIYAIDREASRPTLDLDLLGHHLDSNQAELKSIFQEICRISCSEDGVVFKPDSLHTNEIVKEGRYSGTRIKLDAQLGKIAQKLQIDIGFGDSVIPGPVSLLYPTILEMPQPNILAYTVESLLAEKFEAMIDLSESNSRMKDFYDLYKILSVQKFDHSTLEKAIAETFRKRMTDIKSNHPLFSLSFATAPARVTQWKAFLAKTNLDPSISFVDVMETIRTTLLPIYEHLKRSK